MAFWKSVPNIKRTKMFAGPQRGTIKKFVIQWNFQGNYHVTSQGRRQDFFQQETFPLVLLSRGGQLPLPPPPLVTCDAM